MKWTKKNGEYIIEKDVVYFSISPSQMDEFVRIVGEIDESGLLTGYAGKLVKEHR